MNASETDTPELFYFCGQIMTHYHDWVDCGEKRKWEDGGNVKAGNMMRNAQEEIASTPYALLVTG